MSTLNSGVVIQGVLGSILTAIVFAVPSFAWAQSAGDVVIVGNSSEEQAQLRDYWDQLLELNPASTQPSDQPPLSGVPATVPEIPQGVQPGTSIPTPGFPSEQSLTDTPTQELPPGQTNPPGLEPLPRQPSLSPLGGEQPDRIDDSTSP